MGNTLVRLMLAVEQDGVGGMKDLGAIKRHNAPCDHELDRINEIVATYAAYADAIERVLGASTRILSHPDAKAVREWLVVEDGTS